MPSPPATPAPRAASCFATEAVRQGRPEPPLPPFQPHPSPRLRQIKGGFLRSHQPSRPQEFLIGGKVVILTACPLKGSKILNTMMSAFLNSEAIHILAGCVKSGRVR